MGQCYSVKSPNLQTLFACLKETVQEASPLEERVDFQSKISISQFICFRVSNPIMLVLCYGRLRIQSQANKPTREGITKARVFYHLLSPISDFPDIAAIAHQYK